MSIFADRLLPELWQRVIEHVPSMEDTCSLAVVNKYFYKLVNMDFKQLCYDHVLYRLKGETWAYAFSNFGTRVRSNKERIVCCPFTGKMAIHLKHSTYVLLTNLDFGLREFTLVDFRSVVNIVNVNPFDNGKYVTVHTVDNKLFIIDSETDETYEFCNITWKERVMVNGEHGFFVLQGVFESNVGFRIYNIKRREIVFESEDQDWHFLNPVTIFHPATKLFLVYNKQTDNWIEVKTYPEQLKLMTRNNYLYVWTMRAYKVMETFLNENNNRIYKHIFYRFDKASFDPNHSLFYSK
ncbi:unnamed protein product [Bursaphelenchus okinawaensis]|uniref:F-box domain-containing protein n=1 Tax=Bursaphelenchus okinawaensis TaxID=465554 RepID=A0A811KB86_9BILA|nr:unnamed protein product [Bursaphelenchus okinawaensis]CAG9100774.1 unnamed protein product [Bursaphelenchus okinawaensis]